MNGVSYFLSISVQSDYLSNPHRKLAVRLTFRAVLHNLQLLTQCPLGSESTRSIWSRLGCCWSRLMLYWRRLAHCSGFELKCCPVLESTRPTLESTRQCLEMTRPSGDDSFSGFQRSIFLYFFLESTRIILESTRLSEPEN